ncbi:MAG: hypothetical protein P4L31_08040 [Candidatus Babeliales bacterium]|nr:hypothetical protein [Candidatus Babeliales bacterium]
MRQTMQKWVNIVDTGVGVDIKKLKKIIIDEWQSGELYKFYYDKGNRGADLQNSILTCLMTFSEPIHEEVHEKAVEKSGDLQAATNWIDKYPHSDIRSIGFEVLVKMLSACEDSRHFECLTSEDIPAILEFLVTPPDSESVLKAWDKWEKYWANLDYPERRKKLLENAEK